MDSNKVSDLETLRMAFIRSEMRRLRIASIAITAIGVITFIFLATLARAGYPKVEWQTIALLVFACFCVAFPLFRKFDLSKDGGGFETRDPLELIEAMQKRSEQAGGETFDQIRQQIGALSDQLAELSTLVASASSALAAPAPAGASPVAGEPSLAELRASLPPVTHPEDPQKDRFGGDETNNGRILKAVVSRSAIGKEWQKVMLTVAATNQKPLAGQSAYFFLHDTFRPDEYRAKVARDGLSASVELVAYGAFTVGAIADCGGTHLELDLATSPNVDAPEDWQGR